MKRRLISITLAVVLLLCISVTAFAGNTANEARNGVAVLAAMATVDDKDVCYSYGSCFFVGGNGENPKYIVTNHHLISDYLQYGKGEQATFRDNYGISHKIKMSMRVYFSSDDFVEAYLADYDEGQDIAILKLEKPTDKRVPLELYIPDDTLVGDKMYIIGYPGNTDSILDPTSTWSSEDCVVSTGTIGRFITTSGSGTKWIQSNDAGLGGGNSGGPLLLEDGSVIGLVSSKAVTDNETSNYGVNIEPVIDMLKKNSIDYAIAGADVAEVEEAPVETVEEPTEQPKSFELNTWVFVAAAVAVAAIIAAAIIGSKNKKKKKAAAEKAQAELSKTMPAASAVKEKKQVPAVRSLSAQHSGNKVHIKGEPVEVGRASDCGIIFREDTPGVSGKHCSVSWDKSTKDFVLIDLGSTYGTFLESGQKLDAKSAYHLKAGDSFYLGDKANMLRVEMD